MKRLFSFPLLARALVILLLAGTLAGCGNIVDRDRIRIARIGDSYVTRGDLNRHLRLMEPEERPLINNRGDLLKVLEKYIDETLQKELLAGLVAEGKLEAPQEEQIARVFDAQHPELSISAENLEEFGMTQADYEAIQYRRQQGIEKLKGQVMRQEAVIRAIEIAVQEGKLTISEEEFEEEYELRKDDLFNPEKASFRGLIFPIQTADAGPSSAEARKRLVKEEPWEEVSKSFIEARKAIPLQTTLVNTGQPKFQSFWEQASGTQKGRILGPMIIENWEMVVPGAANQPQRASLSGYLVAEVLEITPPSQKTLDEAKEDMSPALYYVKFMKALREEQGVEIYEDNLPEPSLFREQTEDPLFEPL